MTTKVTSSTAAATLASFSQSLDWTQLPLSVQERTKELILDLLGVAVRGSAEPSSIPTMNIARKAHRLGKASVIGADFSTIPAWAALANGTSAHAIEMDDVSREASLHPGVGVIPCALAVAEEEGSGAADLLAAVVVGYEVTMRVGNALGPASTYRRGFHPTGVAGVFGAAMVAGRLLHLTTEQLVNAMGIAGTLASGSLEYLSDGSWTKRLNAGWAAHSGIMAATLAAEGFTGPSTVLEGPLGLLRGYSDEPNPRWLLNGLGDNFQIMFAGIKPYACCRYNHGLIDCILELKHEHNIRPVDIEAIRLGVLTGGALLVASPIEQKRAPKTVVDAQFSAPFATAVALVRGAAGWKEYCQENVDDPVIREVMARTDCYQDASLDSLYPKQWPAMVGITLKDGRTFSKGVRNPKGEPENPISRKDLVGKFTSLVSNCISPENANELARRVLALDQEPSVHGIMSALSVQQRRKGE